MNMDTSPTAVVFCKALSVVWSTATSKAGRRSMKGICGTARKRDSSEQ